MSFEDIFKTSFLENVMSVTVFDMTLAVALAFVMGLYIFRVYKEAYSGVMYSTNFGITLIAMTMITTVLILAVTSNVVLSLGMVGALSIVRFRTAIKDPVDIAFLFWAIETGIVLAAGLIPLATIANVLIGFVLLFFCRNKGRNNPFMVVVKWKVTQDENKTLEAQIYKCLSNCLDQRVRSRTVRKGVAELNVEIRLNRPEEDINRICDKLEKLGVEAAIVSYNGEYMA